MPGTDFIGRGNYAGIIQVQTVISRVGMQTDSVMTANLAVAVQKVVDTGT